MSVTDTEYVLHNVRFAKISWGQVTKNIYSDQGCIVHGCAFLLLYHSWYFSKSPLLKNMEVIFRRTIFQWKYTVCCWILHVCLLSCYVYAVLAFKYNYIMHIYKVMLIVLCCERTVANYRGIWMTKLPENCKAMHISHKSPATHHGTPWSQSPYPTCRNSVNTTSCKNHHITL